MSVRLYPSSPSLFFFSSSPSSVLLLFFLFIFWLILIPFESRLPSHYYFLFSFLPLPFFPITFNNNHGFWVSWEKEEGKEGVVHEKRKKRLEFSFWFFSFCIFPYKLQATRYTRERIAPRAQECHCHALLGFLVPYTWHWFGPTARGSGPNFSLVL